MNYFSPISINKKVPKSDTQTEWLAKRLTIHLYNVVGQRANILIKFEGN